MRSSRAVTVDLILDTDIGSDVDDALALAFALRHPDIDLRAVTTVNEDTELRARLAAALLRLGGRDDVEVAAGESGRPADRPNWFGHEGEGVDLAPADALSRRDAVTLLVEETARQPCSVATVGMLTNVAAAVDRDPAIVDPVSYTHLTLPTILRV